MNDKVIAAARELGAALQADDRYIQYGKAKEENDSDTALQELIKEFNLKRVQLNQEMNRKEKDQIKLSEIDAEVRYLYGEIMGNPHMEAFTEAKNEMDSLLSQVNAVITMSANGEDPMTCDPTPPASGCSGGCDSCAGCH